MKWSWKIPISGGLVILLLAFALSFVTHRETQATVALGNPDLMAQPCASGYTRVVPRFCMRNTPVLSTGHTYTGVCTLLLTMPTNALYAALTNNTTVISQNAVGTRIMTTTYFIDSGCTTQASAVNPAIQVREQVALAGGVTLLDSNEYNTVQLGPGGVLYELSGLTTCVGCTGRIRVIGYWDN